LLHDARSAKATTAAIPTRCLDVRCILKLRRSDQRVIRRDRWVGDAAIWIVAGVRGVMRAPLTIVWSKFILLTMSGQPNSDRRTVRRQETRDEIVHASWDVVREHGLAGLSMRDLGERVGMRAQSIYSYFASKHEIYDAMFLEGYQACAIWMANAIDRDAAAVDAIGVARTAMRSFVEFCTDDPVRYQLLFQRTIPDFVPSPDSYALAVQVYEEFSGHLSAIGVRDQATLDLWTAMLTGITDQQISNNPGGDRWKQLVDRAFDMLLADTRTPTNPASTNPASTNPGSEKA